MNIDKIFNNLKFKVGPKDNYRKAYLFRLKKSLYKIFNKEKEYIFNNCQISKNIENLNLKKILLGIDSAMSSYANGHIINQICKQLSPSQIYLNIGCWKGFSLVAGMIDTTCKVIGVDNFSQFSSPRDEFLKNFNKHKKEGIHHFYEEDYKIFFKNFEKKNQKIDFYFYDGNHSYKDQYDNLEIADNFLYRGSIVMIDDINAPQVENATKDFINRSISKYKIIKEMKTANTNSHPSYWNGIMILEKK